MFSFSPIVDPIRDVLNSRVRHFSKLIGWATVVVAIGVALEGIEIVHDGIAWVKRRRREKSEHADLKRVADIFPCGETRGETESHPDHPRWVKRWLRVGLIIVVIGVVAEWRCGAKLEDAHDDVHEYDLAKLIEANQKAGEAATSAKTAHDEADIVAKQAAGQGPRAKLLVKAAPELARKLAPFAGQRVGLFVCGRQGTPDQETLDTWGAIANILGSDVVSGTAGAKWKEVPTNLNFADGCGAARGLGQGVIVFVSKLASGRTMEAANILGHGLADALPPSLYKMPSLIDPAFAKLTVDRGFHDKNAPWVSVGLDSDLITVLIGAHP